jgi:hypothetical protein
VFGPWKDCRSSIVGQGFATSSTTAHLPIVKACRHTPAFRIPNGR